MHADRMKNRMRLILGVVVGLLQGCAYLPAINSERFELALADEYTVRYVGPISQANVGAFSRLLREHAASITTLAITSLGGETSAGLLLGRLVHEHKLKVIVREMCASSCANYVVTASNDVLVEEGALLGWHGGALQSLYMPYLTDEQVAASSEEALAALRDRLIQWRREEAEFFAAVGVDQAVTILGMVPGLRERRDAPLFSYDPLTLRALGLRINFTGGQAESVKDGKRVVQIFTLSPAQLDALLLRHAEALAADGAAAGSLLPD